MARFLPALAFAAALTLTSSAAIAAERAGDAALGALSGGVVFGPVGLVAGAVVGYTTGPDIARAWGLRSPHHHRRARSASAVPPAAKAKPIPLPKSRPDAVPSARTTAPMRSAGGALMPPVQSLE